VMEGGRTLNRCVLPHWVNRKFAGIKRSDIADGLDRTEDNHGARKSDLALAYLRTMSNWFTARHDDYDPLTIPGVRRKAPEPLAQLCGLP